MSKMNESYEGKYCCDDMKNYQDDWRWYIDYDPEVNSYFIPMVYPYAQKLHLIYCPWCGKNVAPEWLKEKIASEK